ncbi:TrkH family potassium uptake protein [Saccharophagus sp. K07]|uniref:TrkH family potassium uptake protein n=1 Tax=Saccharophagus sp. K07 TaxID=2283636 RepID=UPI00351C0AEF
MINLRATLYLLAFPVGFMGLVQACFALLSWAVFGDHKELVFAIPAAIMLVCAFAFFTTSRRSVELQIGFRDALLFATFTWIIMSFLGAVPILFITGVSFTDAVFEAVSALTTTGATVLIGLDSMPRTFLMYRQFLQWMGGLGVVIFVVAVLPMLNVGGMKLLKAEAPGPVKDEKLSPRIASTAHYLWFIYVVITLACAASYFAAGMSPYDAIAHAFSTVSTGGMSTYDVNFARFNSPSIMAIADVFMLLGAISFALHFRVIRGGSLKQYWHDEETRVFLLIVLILSFFVTLVLWQAQLYESFFTTLSQATFQLIAFITSTGFAASNYTDWPMSVALVLVVAGYLGGCAGSTAGGNKIIRNILCVKLIGLELKRLMHPRGVFTVKYQGAPVSAPILSATIAFMTIAAFSSVVVTILLMITGLDFWSALTAAAACLNVLGPGFGHVGSNFIPVSDAGTWILSGAMVLGRLEYFTVIALFLPTFWQR